MKVGHRNRFQWPLPEVDVIVSHHTGLGQDLHSTCISQRDICLPLPTFKTVGVGSSRKSFRPPPLKWGRNGRFGLRAKEVFSIGVLCVAFSFLLQKGRDDRLGERKRKISVTDCGFSCIKPPFSLQKGEITLAGKLISPCIPAVPIPSILSSKKNRVEDSTYQNSRMNNTMT